MRVQYDEKFIVVLRFPRYRISKYSFTEAFKIHEQT